MLLEKVCPIFWWCSLYHVIFTTQGLMLLRQEMLGLDSLVGNSLYMWLTCDGHMLILQVSLQLASQL